MNQQSHQPVFVFLSGLLVLFLSACSSIPQNSTPFLPPGNNPPPPSPTAGALSAFSPPPDTSSVSGLIPLAAETCSNNLRFIADNTVPDGTVFTSGARIDKRWQVENNGTCAWHSQYRLRLIAGFEMGAPIEQALYPLRPNAQAEIAIMFIAPPQAGLYRSEWKAYGPDGLPFGESIFIEIIVQNP